VARRRFRPAPLALALIVAAAGGPTYAQDGAGGPLARPAPEVPLPLDSVPATRPEFDTGQSATPLPPPGTLVPFLFINQESLLTGSRAGQAILADEDRQRDALRAEARALDEAFEAEERRLTDQRPTLPPEEFSQLSDAFDARVVQARRDQDNRAAALAQEFDQRRRQFYAQVAPILVALMERYGARAIFDETSVLLADQSLNITRAVVAEIDARASDDPDRQAPAAPPAETNSAPADQQGGN
jgi:Skp family chaperone for outer membrane proteins